PPPPEHPPQVDWEAAQRDLGTPLPPDYIALADRYGAGQFGAIAIHVPQHPNRHLELLEHVERWRHAHRYMVTAGEQLPYDPDELLSWGSDEAGNGIFWHTAGRPHEWRVIAQEARGDEWLAFDGGTVAFLLAALEGRLPSTFLMLDGDPVFTPFPYGGYP